MRMNKEIKFYNWIKKILCFISIHDYRWYVYDNKPVTVRCSRCGKKPFKKKKNQKYGLY